MAELVPSRTIRITKPKIVLSEHCLQHITRKSRSLAEAADGIAIPIAAIGNVNAKLVAGPDNTVSQLLGNTQQHLELVGCWWQLQLTDQAKSFIDDGFIVSRDPDIQTI